MYKDRFHKASLLPIETVNFCYKLQNVRNLVWETTEIEIAGKASNKIGVNGERVHFRGKQLSSFCYLPLQWVKS